MSKDSIRLSEKHGVNPALYICFWCGEAAGVALMGRLRDDKQAPRKCVLDYEFCDKCKERTTRGFALLEAVEEPNGNPPIKENAYPTGRWWVITKECANRIFVGVDLTHGKAFITPDLAEKIGLMDVEAIEVIK